MIGVTDFHLILGEGESKEFVARRLVDEYPMVLQGRIVGTFVVAGEERDGEEEDESEEGYFFHIIYISSFLCG